MYFVSSTPSFQYFYIELVLPKHESAVEMLSTVLGSMWNLLFTMCDQGVACMSESMYAAELDSLLLLLSKYKPDKQMNSVSYCGYYCSNINLLPIFIYIIAGFFNHSLQKGTGMVTTIAKVQFEYF